MPERVTALSGGIGGAKLALGFAKAEADLTVIANTGDDFAHYGLPICPDIDTLIYTLSGTANVEQGWGRADESLHVRDELAALGEDIWFTLGDKDIALHLLRARLLGEGAGLSEVTAEIARRFGLDAQIIPMSDEPAPTVVETADGSLAFQDYFVRLRCEPELTGVRFPAASAAPTALAALEPDAADLIVICPSNPLLSIGPILACDGMRTALEARVVPTIAVSPIVGGAAVKGPTAKIFRELGMEVNGLEVAKLYRGLVDLFVLDETERELAEEIEALEMRVAVTDTLMQDDADKQRLARFCLDLV